MMNKLNEALENLHSVNSKFEISDDYTTYSGKDFIRIVKAFVALFDARNLKKHDRVLISCEKSINQAACIVACYVNGQIFVPLLPKQNLINIKHIIDNSSPSLIIFDQNRRNEIDENIQSFDINQIDSFINKSIIPININQSLLDEEPVGIIYSSGSTGLPKGICFSRRNITDGAEIVSGFTKLNTSDRLFSPLSLNFDYGLNQLWQAILMGCSIKLHEYTYPTAFFNIVEKFSPTILPLMPIFIANLIDPRFEKKLNRYDNSSVRLITTSGGMVSERMQSELLHILPNAELMLMYGLTEAFRSTYLDPSIRNTKPNSIGKAIPKAQVWIGREDFVECKVGEIGEIFHSNGCMSLGYWNDLPRTEKRFVRDKILPNKLILKTGDFGYKDDQGFLFFVGRKDEMIKTRGYRVSPFEIEQIGLMHLGIKKCMAFGVSDEILTNKLIFCFERDGQELSLTELKLFFQKKCPGYQVPEVFLEISSIPETGNQGKIDRIKTKQIALKILNA